MPIERQENSAVLFADISGSTQVVRHGRRRARARNRRAHARPVGASHHERRRPRHPAARRRHALHVSDRRRRRSQRPSRMRDLPYEPPLSMHAGLNAGAVLREEEQLYGDAVNVAARMADIAKQFEIVMTEAAYSQLARAQPLEEPAADPQGSGQGQTRADEHLLAAERAAGAHRLPATAAHENHRRAAQLAVRATVPCHGRTGRRLSDRPRRRLPC